MQTVAHCDRKHIKHAYTLCCHVQCALYIIHSLLIPFVCSCCSSFTIFAKVEMYSIAFAPIATAIQMTRTTHTHIRKHHNTNVRRLHASHLHLSVATRWRDEHVAAESECNQTKFIQIVLSIKITKFQTQTESVLLCWTFGCFCNNVWHLLLVGRNANTFIHLHHIRMWMHSHYSTRRPRHWCISVFRYNSAIPRKTRRKGLAQWRRMPWQYVECGPFHSYSFVVLALEVWQVVEGRDQSRQ